MMEDNQQIKPGSGSRDKHSMTHDTKVFSYFLFILLEKKIKWTIHFIVIIFPWSYYHHDGLYDQSSTTVKG